MKATGQKLVVGVILLLVLSASLAKAQPPKRGRVLCEGDGCQAQNVPIGGEIELFDGPALSKSRSLKDIPLTAAQSLEKPLVNRKVRRDTRSAKSMEPAITNLPKYYQGIDRSQAKASERVVFVPKSSDPRLSGLKSGDIVWAVVEQQITASPSVATPVRAVAISGRFKGSYFVGEAILDRELKRILFSFTKLRLRGEESVYALKAAGLSPQGSIGLEGDYHSQTGKFFIAELASAAAAGYLDSTIGRNQTALGTYAQEPSLANSGKVAGVTALSKTAERAADAARTAPEYTQVAGYQEIQIIIQEDPIETGV